MLRATSANEKHGFAFPSFPQNAQVAVQVKDKKDMPKLIENFKKAFIGLRTRYENNAIHSREDPMRIFKLPDTIRSPKDACNFMVERLNIPIDDALACLAINEDIVVVNTHHVFADGAFMKQFHIHCFDDIDTDGIKVSVPSEVVYKEQLEYMRKHMPKDLYMNKQLTTLTCKPKNIPDSKGSNILDYEIPVEKLQCYDAKLKRPVKLTDSLWATASLAMCTMENDFTRFGINTAVDIRHYLKDKRINWSYTDHYSVPNIVAKNHSMNLTIKELGNEFRKYYNYLYKGYGLLYPYNFKYDLTYPKSIYMNISNVGPVKVDERVKDFYMQGNDESPGTETFIYLYSFSKIIKESNRFCSRMRFPRQSITKKNAQILNDSIYHLLVDVPLDTTLREAVAELRDYQKKLGDVY